MDSDEENKCPKLANSMSNLTSSVESEERISNELNTRRQTTVINRFLMLKKGEVSDSSSCSSTSCSPITPSSVESSPVKLRDLPHTTTLNRCVAFVDVWSTDGTDNCSSVFRNFLIRMGATVYRKLTKEHSFTHVIFKDGHKSVLQKAQKRNIKVVTCLWVERCRVLQEWVDEKDYIFDTKSYRPPKRFIEMQPQDPEEYVRKSEERLKKRKARFAKKHARIMFQSPLVTHSTNGTPGNRTPTENNNKWKNVIFAPDTPHYPPSPLPFIYPSIVYETPLTDSLQRKLQRLKEGKPILSPPSSSDEERPNKTSPDKTYSERNDNINGETENRTSSDSTSGHLNGPASKYEDFSPVPDTQFYCDNPRRRRGIAPLNFDISIDEIPETQIMGSEENNLIEKKKDNEVNRVSPNEKCNNLSSSTTESESQLSLNLHISIDSSICDDTTVLQINLEEQEANDKLGKKTEELSCLLNKNQKRKRKLLNEADDRDQLSFLLSPKTDIASFVKDKEQENSKLGNHDTGRSTFKTISTNGRYFTELPANTPSESSESAVSYKISSTRSTEYDLNEEEVLPVSNSCLSMYDRIKRKKRAARAIGDDEVLESPRKRRRKIVSGNAYERAIFQSQMAVSILDEVKRRRSTMDFATPLPKEYEIPRKRQKKVVIVLSNLHSDERPEIMKAISTLGNRCVTSKVNNSTTHVVSGASRRTINVLQAICRGLWLLSVNWVKDSISAGFWLDEESYEVPSIFPTAQKNRIAKQTCTAWSNNVFSKFEGHVFIADNTNPSQEDLCRLIALCGGNTIGSLRRAAICIGSPGRPTMNDIPAVKETWVLDSITAHSLLPIDEYLISRR